MKKVKFKLFRLWIGIKRRFVKTKIKVVLLPQVLPLVREPSKPEDSGWQEVALAFYEASGHTIAIGPKGKQLREEALRKFSLQKRKHEQTKK